MKAVILAAGRSSRLYPLTAQTPKPLLPVADRSIIERSVDLITDAGISDIVVVVGFEHQKVRQALDTRVRFVLNPFYSVTNNMASLWFAIPEMNGEDFIYLHGDVIYDQPLLERMVNGPSKHGISLLVDYQPADEEAMKVRVSGERFVESSKGIPLSEAAGEWTGIARVSTSAAGDLSDAIESILLTGEYQLYDASAFNELAKSNMPFNLISTDNLPWCEIDTKEDLDRARLMFIGPDSIYDHDDK